MEEKIWSSRYEPFLVKRTATDYGVVFQDYAFAENLASDLKIVVISDTHNKHQNIVTQDFSGDLLIHCGDFTVFGTLEEAKTFLEWFSTQKFTQKVMIAGNHDLCCFNQKEEWNALLQEFPSVTYLLDSSIDLRFRTEEREEKIIKVYGSPWTIDIGSRYNAFTCDSLELLREKHQVIPNHLAILITHGPPFGHRDRLSNKSSRLSGDVGLFLEVEKKVPTYHVFGHIHNSYGCSTNQKTIFVNASICDDDNNSKNDPIHFFIS